MAGGSESNHRDADIMIRQCFSLAVVFLLAAVDVTTAQETITQEELLRRSQELFDSLVAGNKEPWQKYYADDAIYFDEKGRNLDKTALVADIAPLPPG